MWWWERRVCFSHLVFYIKKQSPHTNVVVVLLVLFFSLLEKYDTNVMVNIAVIATVSSNSLLWTQLPIANF